MTFYQSLSKMLKESDEIQDTIEQDVKTCPCEEPVIESDDNSSILDRVAELKIAIQDGVSDDEKEALLKEIKEIEASICPDCTEPSEDAPVEEVPEESNEALDDCEKLEETEFSTQCTNDGKDLAEKYGLEVESEETKDKEHPYKCKFKGPRNKVAKMIADEFNSDEEIEECNQEEIKECEVKSSRILRVAPSTKAYMIEAQTKEGLAYIVGKNYDSKTKILDEAEIFTDKAKASNHFKTLLKK